MKRKFLFAGVASALILSSAALTSCDEPNEGGGGNGTTTRRITVENVTTAKDFVQSGTFQHSGSSPMIQPGQTAQIRFNAGRGQVLAFATMYANSKDLFFAPSNPGIMLFEANGTPVTGDVSAQIKLWDNGTIANSDPAIDAGSQSRNAEDVNIREIAGTDGTYTYPAASDMMKLTLAYDANTSEFTLTILNNTNNTAVQTAFSAGVWAVSNISGTTLRNQAPFYRPAEKTTDELTALATMGNTQPFTNWLDARTGIVTNLSPMLVVIYTGNVNPIFTVGQSDAGLGLRNLAQAGDATVLRAAMERQTNVRKAFIVGDYPIEPGVSANADYEAFEGDRIAFVTKFSSSNDWFYANNSSIFALHEGDVTTQISLYDHGSAVSQYPGAGNAQPGFSNRPIAEEQVIRIVNRTTYPTIPVPAVDEMIKVTIR